MKEGERKVVGVLNHKFIYESKAYMITPYNLNSISDGIRKNRISVTMKYPQFVRACLKFGRDAESFRCFHLRVTAMAKVR